MNHATDDDRLLEDVMADGLPPEFRAMLLGETLRQARRRRWARQTRPVAATLAVLAGLAALLWRTASPPSVTREATSQSVAIVRSQPLPASRLITTRPLSADHLVGTFASAQIVQTPPADGQVHLIDDAELLALAAPKPAALVRWGSDAPELVFVNPADQQAFPKN